MTKKIAVIMMVVIVCLMSNTISFAENKNTINIVGKLSNNLSLSTDNDYIFQKEHIVPGESWITHINITNQSSKEIQISLLDIQNNIADDTLEKAMILEISLDGVTLYSGSYAAVSKPVIEKVIVKAGQTITMLVQAGVDERIGNNIQDSVLDSTWIFEATAPNTASKPSGKSSGSSSGLIATGWQYDIVCENENGEPIMRKTSVPAGDSHITVAAPVIEGYKSTVAGKTVSLKKNNDNVVVFTYYLIQEKGSVIPAEKPLDSISPEVDVENNDGNVNNPLEQDAGSPVDKLDENNGGAEKYTSEHTNEPVQTGNEKMLSDTVLFPFALIGIPILAIIALFVLCGKKKNNKDGGNL